MMVHKSASVGLSDFPPREYTRNPISTRQGKPDPIQWGTMKISLTALAVKHLIVKVQQEQMLPPGWRLLQFGQLWFVIDSAGQEKGSGTTPYKAMSRAKRNNRL